MRLPKGIGAHHVAAVASVAVLGLAGATLGVVATQSTTVTTSPVPVLVPEPGTTAAVAGIPAGCGSERFAVKHLTDGFTLPAPTVMTVDQLVSMQAPPVSQNSPRLSQETVLVQLNGVHVIAAKQEPDSDLHVIIATRTGAEMNVEAPMARCDLGSRYAGQMAQARASLDAALGPVSSSGYSAENVTATIRGVLFFDVLHGQRGAPNGIELHPVLCFKLGGGSCSTGAPGPPPPPGQTTTTAAAPPPPPPRKRDSDYKADPAECANPPASDSDTRDDAREGC